MQEEIGRRLADVLARAGIAHVDRRRVAVVLAVAAVVVVACVVRWWPSGGDGYVVERTARSSAEEASGAAGAATSSESMSGAAAGVYVHVVGAVRAPGLVRLPAGSRIADAVDAAGGLLSNAEARGVNLARLAVDGEQIVVPTMDEWATVPAPGPSASAGGTSASGSSAAGAKVDLNTADAAALDALPGVGPSTAAKIIADRESNGPFSAPEDLMRVSGIGEKKFEALKEYLVVR